MPVDDELTRESNTVGTGREGTRGLEYGAYYFADYRGTPYERNEFWIGFFSTIANRIVADLRPSSVLDAGCAIGMLVEALRERSVDAWGIDVSEWAIANLVPGAAGRCERRSLADPIDGRYDLVTCIEVLEHIPEPDTSRAICNICRATDRVLFSSAPFDYAEPTHVNVRSPEDWAAAFAAQGFVRNLDFDASFVAPWAVLYERTDASMAELVRSYERKLFRLNREVADVRTTVLSLQGQLEDIAPIRRQLEESQQALRARDELMGLEGELGEARARASELEGELERYVYAVRELEFFRRSFVWRAYAPYARLRARIGGALRAIRDRLG